MWTKFHGRPRFYSSWDISPKTTSVNLIVAVSRSQILGFNVVALSRNEIMWSGSKWQTHRQTYWLSLPSLQKYKKHPLLEKDIQFPVVCLYNIIIFSNKVKTICIVTSRGLWENIFFCDLGELTLYALLMSKSQVYGSACWGLRDFLSGWMQLVLQSETASHKNKTFLLGFFHLWALSMCAMWVPNFWNWQTWMMYICGSNLIYSVCLRQHVICIHL